jgi:biotin carboxyl carrier protein
MRQSRALLVVPSNDPDQPGEVLAAPGPGRVKWRARAGEALVDGSSVGLFVQGERWYELVLPAGVRGQIRSVLRSDPWVLCAHGTPLAVLGDVAAEAVGRPEEELAAAGGELWAVRSATHGTFYRRSGPDAPPYVDVGAQLAPGDVLGLVEVMKCFSPVLFQPPAGIGGGTVREILVNDGVEVRVDQVLMRIAPI